MFLNLRRTSCVISLLIIISLVPGCLETPQTSPATIDENALETHGWSLVSIEENSFEQNITDSRSIFFNSSTVKYHNDRLITDINEQVNDFKEKNRLPVSIEIPDTISARIITYRLSMPSGAKLPTGIVSGIMDNKMDEIRSGNDAEGFKEASTREITLGDGTRTVVRIFTASGNSTETGMRIMGFVTAFESDGSSTIVMGFVPDGEYNIDAGMINGTLFSIDGNRELDGMLELVATIE